MYRTLAAQLQLLHRQIISYPEGKLQVFSSPHLHTRVVRPQVVEVVLAHRKQTACHSRRPESKINKDQYWKINMCDLCSCRVLRTHLMTSVDERRRFCSYSGTACHVKTSRQSKPPIWGSPELPKYWNVFQSITSMTGHTTAFGSSLILEEKFSFHQNCT